MRKLIFLGICYLGFAASYADDTATVKAIKDSFQHPVSTNIKIDYPLKSLKKAALFSALLPGCGQVYTGHYYKGSMFFAAETILGFVCYNYYSQDKYFHDNTMRLFDSVTSYKDSILIKSSTIRNKANTEDSTYSDSTFYETHYRMQYDYQKFLERENRSVLYQGIIWLSGLYYWNILDAIKCSGFFNNNNVRDPAKAGWLSAVPVLALGQFYNGELSKAGMIFTVQLSMGYMVYNYNNTMRICENHIRQISTPGTREGRDVDSADMASKWESKRSDAFKNRNMWGWYSIAFYMYGILDAVVDAHLHDAADKMRLEPDLIYDRDKIGLNMKMNF
jgi:hypothetical protein